MPGSRFLATPFPCRALLALLLLVLPVAQAAAATRAWLDRDRIEVGETVTLNIQTDTGGRPDYAPLARDFAIEQQSSRQSHELQGGRLVSQTLYAVALRPAREGELVVPALQVGSERTAPLRLEVSAASQAQARDRGPAWIDAELDDASPYVQQAVGLRLRLHYSVQLVSGQLDLEAPDGIALQRVGSDLQYTRDIGGRRVQVVERRYVLVPERSGRFELPAARFSGRGVGGLLDDLFGRGQRSLSATGPSLRLDVRPVPDAAPRPWLPLAGLELRWLDVPSQARAGEAFAVELEMVADGAVAAQLPPLGIEADQGAQVFPDPPRHDETVEDGRPRVRMLRRFSVLPAREGLLRIEVPGIGWWDVGADRARTAAPPPLTLDVGPGPGPGSGGLAPWPSAEEGSVRVPGVQGRIGRWALATVVFALLWLLTLAWALHWRQRAVHGGPAEPGDVRGRGDGAAHARAAGAALRRALDTGDAGDVAAALCALASPPAPDLDALAAKLAPGQQRDAIARLQRARWGQGEGGIAEARTAVRTAFARGPDWLADVSADAGPLPPLYPRRGPRGPLC